MPGIFQLAGDAAAHLFNTASCRKPAVIALILKLQVKGKGTPYLALGLGELIFNFKMFKLFKRGALQTRYIPNYAFFLADIAADGV